MRYIRPDYYDTFRCLADRCPSSCCEGWQIVIDEASLEKYRGYQGDFGRRMARSVSWEDGTFRQYEGRCAMLNREGLCDLYIEKGEEALCETCTRYPRHVEEFENVREYSLSLSCPEAARIMLEEDRELSFVTEDTPEEETFEEGFDFLLYTNLVDAREALYALLQRRDLPFEEKERACLAFAGGVQLLLEEGDYPGMEEWIRTGGKQEPGLPEEERWVNPARLSRYDRLLEELRVLEGLERLEPAWEALLREEEAFLRQAGGEKYEKIRASFRESLESSGPGREAWDRRLEKLALFFVYTYFCGAVYDDAVHAKVCLAFFSTRWIQELVMMEWYVRGTTADIEALIRMSRRYAREIEHSDENLNALDDYFWDRTHEKRAVALNN